MIKSRSTITVLLLMLAALCVRADTSAETSTKIIGEFRYQSYLIQSYFSTESTIALICVSQSLKAQTGEYVPKSGQILGRLTSPLAPPPIRFEIDLPIVPTGDSIDLDNNGKPDRGVQVYAAIMALNLFGDSYLEQLEQGAGFTSVLTDPKTGTVSEGTLLSYSPDNNQKISSGFGADKRLFTDDDPTTSLPQGYSLMRIQKDGTITFERTEALSMSIFEPEGVPTPDFSQQGILQSYNSLLDMLTERYAYTDLRKIDWKSMRARFLPRVQQADANKDMLQYYLTLTDMAVSIRDGHVQVKSLDIPVMTKRVQLLQKRTEGNLGAKSVRLSDGRFIVVSVTKDSPAEKAGFTFGTEIVKVNGQPVRNFLLTDVPQVVFTGTEEKAIDTALTFLFSFPLNEKVTIDYRQPGTPDVRSAELVAGDYPDPAYPSPNYEAPISFKFLKSNYGYIQWRSFQEIALNIATLETFLRIAHNAPGIIIDLRGNLGGNVVLMYTMASYLFPPDKAVTVDWLDSYNYDEAAHTWLKSPEAASKISSPVPEIAYPGQVVVLVNGGSASAGEFFPQFLQKMGRAKVVAERGTDGAGGALRQVTMPGQITFTYTGVQMFFKGTHEVNLEAKGVTPDIKVPINEENERRKLAGEDVVLDAAIKYLDSVVKPK